MQRKRKAYPEAEASAPVEPATSSTTSSASKLTAVPYSANAADLRFKALYSKPSDFKQLARLDPEFAAVVKGRDLNFRDPESVLQLTKTLLKLDFGLKIELPSDRLCPPVPNRHNYILWLKDLLDTSSYDGPARKLTGMDIGTGASCIYPLLGCSQRPWSFIATDIDGESLKWARRNVEINDLSSRIKVVDRSMDGPIIPLDELALASIDFTMTNPPFYMSEEDLLSVARKKRRPPYTACTGSTTEMVTPGGELAFVDRILNESRILRERIQWYSAMFGFLSNLTTFIEQLRAAGICNYAVTEFVQGNKTRRWAVAWSFQPMRPSQHVARGTRSASSKNILPHVTEAEGNGRAIDKVWARAWRRRKKRGQRGCGEDEDGAISETDVKCMFGFKVWIRVSMKEVVVGCRWLEGFDATAFESFQGFLKSTAQEAANLN
ncbi:hypothetical protein ED733_008642 [Metarhizium rileyi]|uniref:DUF890 domain-containing protein n=1 Tax=Metarhizium rileyi (strain RCEF 4871) TaxID=1649241 RepID=A0A5C6GPW0_METRR|nr:hypothetical protein ED733_008642 [Metarhizium rileyi]